MNTEEFKTVVEGAICDLISDESFAHVALRNWTDSLGNEEELYPYLAELIRRRLSCEVIGIGWGKYSNTNEKADCICHFKADSRKTTFAVELKGPSKDNAWVLNGLKKI